MKQVIRYILVLSMLLVYGNTRAQEANILSIADVRGSMGSQVALPILLNNTCNDIVAVQFRLTLSDGLTLDAESSQFGIRTSKHSAVVQKNGNSYVVMVYAPDNSIIAGNAGQLMTIGLNIPTGLTPGGEYALTMSEVLLSNKAGENVMTSFNSGTLHIAEVTDFVVSDVQATTEGVLAPGDAINVAWMVKNQGGLASTGGWSEQVSLVGSNGRTVLLGTVYHDDPLDAGAAISRQSEVLIPTLPGIDGQAQVRVKVLPNSDSGEMAEYQTNNATLSTQTMTLSKQLTLTTPQTATESDRTLKCVLARSGNWSVAQAFNIRVEGDVRLSAPATVIIPRGQSSVTFNLTINDDDLLNTESHFTIQASGNDYDPVSTYLEMEDNEYPVLSLTASKTDITEGETLQLTVSTPVAVNAALDVLLFCEKGAKFNYPASVTIGKGETTATVNVEAIDDSEVDETLPVVFIAEATRYSRAEAVVLLADNDIPDIELNLTPTVVNESAGASAIIGKVKKLNRKDSKITVKLTDDAGGRLYYSDSTLEMGTDVEETEFSIGIIDNATVDGDISAKVTAAIYISSCSCSVNATSGGSVTKNITILDDDGPSLKLTASSTTMLEGSQNNILTIERNTSVADALTVTLNSDKDDVLIYSHTVVIPAGQKAVHVNVAVAENDEQGDNKTVAFTVMAGGYCKGTCWMMICDQTLPDVSLSELMTDSHNYESGGQMEVSVKVTNNGNAVYPAPAKILLFMDNNGNILSPIDLNEDLEPGTSTIVSKTMTLPTRIGICSLKAEINHDRTVEELLYANNMSERTDIELLPLFTATVAPTKDSYSKGETVILQGKAIGCGAAEAEVEVYIIQNGTRQTIVAKTDVDGSFNVEWKPYASQMGRFVVGACYPGEYLTKEQAAINIIGLRRATTGYITCETLVGETYRGNIVVENPGVLPQTFSNLEVLKQPANCEVAFTKPATVDGGETATIAYTLKGNAVTDGNDWEDLMIRLTTNEGAVLDIDMFYYCLSPKAVLQTSISSINTTMVKGLSREYSLLVSNSGMGATGKITLSLPDLEWMESVTPLEMGSLNNEETAEIILRLTPTDDMAINVPLTGRIALNCENGNGIVVPYSIEPISNTTGTLMVDVTDEYTYYAVAPEESGSRMVEKANAPTPGPHVAGAIVEVRHPVTNAIIATGQTGSDGTLTMEIPEGFYTLMVTESNHDSYSGTVQVDPGIVNLQDIFIGFKAITYSWEVEETEVKDEYNLETIAKFTTNVPKPVLVISFPNSTPYVNGVFPVVVTNQGLITANGTDIDLFCSDGYELEILNKEELQDLAPQQSFVCYAFLKEAKEIHAAQARRSPEIDAGVTKYLVNPCFYVGARVGAWYFCHDELKTIETISNINYNWGKCTEVGVAARIAEKIMDWVNKKGKTDNSNNNKSKPNRPSPPIKKPTQPGTPMKKTVPSQPIQLYPCNKGKRNSRMYVDSEQDAFDSMLDANDSPELSVCATISLQLSQTMTMTRQAFRGTLTVFNGHDTMAMRDVKLSLEVRDEEGTLATAHEFQISVESLKQFNGDLGLNSGWTLDAQQTGIATVLFIPTKYAALTEDKVYSFGGTLSYVDPFTNLTVARTLYPVGLTVKPSPNLELTYFMQRDILGDDALTLDIVESSEPAEFSLVFKNNGNGAATNVRMVTDQPRIIENEKGLLVDFKLISSILNGQETTLALGQSVATNFGNIGPQSTTYAQWMIQSSLLGHFIEYDTKATHVSSYENPDLSLLDAVTVHELIHGFNLKRDNGKTGRAFLANDIPDDNDTPDAIYFTDGTQQSLSIASNSTLTRTSNTECRLSVNGTSNSWNYGVLADPTVGKQKLKAVVRQRDGKLLPPECFWQTDRTLRDNKEWLYEYRLHFADSLTSTQEEYVLTFEAAPAILLSVESFFGTPSINNVAKEPIQVVEVRFNKEIEEATFTQDDLRLSCQGETLDATKIGIRQTGTNLFSLDLSALTQLDGYYTLTVQTDGITDTEGFQGKVGQKVEWVQYSGKVSFAIKVSPEGGGIVTPEERSADYETTVPLKAIPNAGYEFAYWNEKDDILSRNPEYGLTVLPDKVLTAVFVPCQYYVSIDYDNSQGDVNGASTGIYPHGTQLEMTVIPDEDYILKGWSIDGEALEGNDNELTVTVDKALNIDITFLQEYFRQKMMLARGWNWISSYLDESLDVGSLTPYVHRIVSQEEELINDPEYGLVGDITELQAGKAYKIQANSRFTNSFRGHLYDVETAPISLHKGWNWVAYPNKGQIALATFITNAEEGDYIASQTGFAEFADGSWEGTLDILTPGEGYLYKSATDKALSFDFTASVNGSRSWKARTATVTEQDIDIHRYPNTMNVTARIYRDGAELAGDDYIVYALVGDEVRGISQCVSGSHYLTVYGDVPVDVTFLVESAGTGETFVADETLKFHSDVVGSRKAPFAINISGATGIDSFVSSGTMTVYTLEGVLVSRDATLKTLRRLPKGIYIVNGQKRYVK